MDWGVLIAWMNLDKYLQVWFGRTKYKHTRHAMQLLVKLQKLVLKSHNNDIIEIELLKGGFHGSVHVSKSILSLASNQCYHKKPHWDVVQ